MKKKKKRGIKEIYKDCFNYLKESKKFIWIIIGIFFLFFLLGFFVSPPEQIRNQILEYIQNLLGMTEGMSQIELTSFIFFNNIQSSFFAMAFGILFGIFPIIGSLANGYLLGFVSVMSVESSGILSLWKILPHGIFELPAVFISFGLGLKFGMVFFQKNKKDFLKYNLKNAIEVFLFVVFPLLIIAAIIEGALIFLSV